MSLFDVYPLYDVAPVKAENVFVYDEKGTKYLDLYGGHAVISIGHAHPEYVKNLSDQLSKIAFYSNAVQNPIQTELGERLPAESNCPDYQLFLCNSGAEANENALKLASFHTNRKKVIAFNNSFHGRTSAAVAATDNPKIVAPINAQQEVSFLPLGDLDALENHLKKEDVCAVILEFIQGVGGLDESDAHFYEGVDALCKKYGTCLIADEVQAGFGRTGKFFAFQEYNLEPEIISIAKGMGNGFPVGGILIHPSIKAQYGMLGTTFGGNHLACVATLTVLDVLKKEKLMENAAELSKYFFAKAKEIPQIKKVKGRGLMLGIEFDEEVGQMRKDLIYKHQIFTGGASNKNLIRILPPLTVKKEHFDTFFDALKQVLKEK
ncbi:aspartate aminotransferase family protein [Flavimarina sp. Hel_I_48]|uniref:aspartate aminotransferase family protein n=1 Tax=Flavimarina sp. Hel_I_48 TaxID=1392488 RepID=UPI0004DEF72E|nr:aminotransferase class III-fold pyridoxal phosphate-dependent enzyme [Flavimarina sp. Hel_I_48]